MLCQTLERILCGFNYMLKRMDHPAGGSYWDHTIVGIISEFGRDNLMGSGYNSGGGSDHVGSPGSRYQAYCVMGGPVGAKGAKLGATDPSSMEMMGSQVYGTTDYLATLTSFLDIDHTEIWPSATPILDLW
jgi:hypothetical protein